MVISYNFENFDLGVSIPTTDNSKLVDEFQLINLDMSSVITPTISQKQEVFTLKQVHGTNVVIISEGKIYYDGNVLDFSYSLDHSLEADGIITNDRNIRVGIRTADCAPVMFYFDGVVGGIHCGWRGLKGRIVKKVVSLAKDMFQVNEERSKFFILPCIHVCCYEVGSEFLEWASDFCLRRGEKIYFDIPKFIISELKESGVIEENIYYSPLCTSCYSNVLPSYRANKTEDRIIAFISLKS